MGSSMPDFTAAAGQGGHAGRNPWLLAAGCVLLAYALMGKGAGYVGLPPVFIGEILLLLGVASLVVFGWSATRPMPRMLWFLILFAAWGLCRTIAYLPIYGVDALRDAVIWGYAAFAGVWLLYILSKPLRLVHLLGYYRVFAGVALVGMPLLWAVRYLLGDATPKWPWADAAIIEPKPGDIMAHLCGILAFWVSRPGAGPGLWRLGLFALTAAVVGAYERAALFALLAVFFLCWVFRPGHPALWKLAAMAVLGLLALAVSGIELQVPVADSAKVREISFRQFTANVLSAVGSSDMGDLDDNKEWRLAWWGEIADYTLHGDYLWLGKGFGVNLADDDGFQVMQDHSLRSPHNASMMILARSGLPGLVFWAIVQLGWAWLILRALVISVRAQRHEWAGVFLLLLAYWSAFMINGMFDVFLEGPMGGIWFWSIYGVGLAALSIFRQCPDLLASDANPDRP